MNLVWHICSCLAVIYVHFFWQINLCNRFRPHSTYTNQESLLPELEFRSLHILSIANYLKKEVLDYSDSCYKKLFVLWENNIHVGTTPKCPFWVCRTLIVLWARPPIELCPVTWSIILAVCLGAIEVSTIAPGHRFEGELYKVLRMGCIVGIKY